MESLKVKSFNSVLKDGQWNRVLLPVSLRTDLINQTNRIHSSMSENSFWAVPTAGPYNRCCCTK